MLPNEAQFLRLPHKTFFFVDMETLQMEKTAQCNAMHI